MKLSVPRTTPKFNPIITPQTPLKTLTKSPDRIPTITCQVKFRPCIDIHKGKVKQIVGSTLSDEDRNGSGLVTNFVSEKSAAEYAELYREDGLVVGHVIMLGGDPLSRAAAAKALRAYPGGLQIGGGVTKDNAASYIDGGASHVTVTSYVFSNGQMDLDRLRGLVVSVGRNRIVLDLSCRKKDGRYAIVTNRWQKFSDVYLDEVSLAFLASYADEFLVHGVDVEGKSHISLRRQQYQGEAVLIFMGLLSHSMSWLNICLNEVQEKMDMTTPVITRRAISDGEKMEMTTPVITKKSDQETWQMSFVMPSKYGANLPLPKDPSVRIKKVPKNIIAVVAFSGFVTDEEVAVRESKLRDDLKADVEFQIKDGAMVEVSQYNPPFTLPFTRRNEIALEVEWRKAIS